MDGSIAGRDVDLYEADEYAWLLRQVGLIRENRLSDLDAANLLEFLESMAKRELREVKSRLTRLLQHLLKFKVQAGRATRSWTVTILTQQSELRDILESPSLRREVPALMGDAWSRARKFVSAETGIDLSNLPIDNPWSLDEALSWNPPSFAQPAAPRRRKDR